MKIEADRLEYRRANASDVEVLVDYRIRFLNELYHHPEDSETQVLREALQEYFARATIQEMGIRCACSLFYFLNVAVLKHRIIEP
jgi:hypothetical protein